MLNRSNKEDKEIVVIGAGVIGLTTALKIQEKGGYRVTVIAEHLPSDPKDAYYASCWAGAHHVTVAGTDPRQKRLDLETFEMMWKLSELDADTEALFMRLPQTEYYRHKRNSPDALDLMPGFRELEPEELVPGAESGLTYNTVNTDVPKFLNWLYFRFLSKGGQVIRGSVQHISQIIEGGAGAFDKAKKPGTPDGIVICAGLGARFLGGVEDKDVYPMRGQVLLIRAPWVKNCMSMSGGSGRIWTYVIPRRSGDVIIGGTMGIDDWYPLPRAETTRDIIERVLEMTQEIAPPSVREKRKPIVEDILPLVLEEGCGFRPSRKGGIRLEGEIRFATEGKKVVVVHNYGHSGYGYLACFGSASMALELLEEKLAGITT